MQDKSKLQMELSEARSDLAKARIILVLVLGQRYCGRFIFGAFGSKVCPCLTTEFVDACSSKHVRFQVPNFDPPPGLQMRHRPVETRPNLRS